MTRGIAILGSTGSIGTSTLDVIRRNQERYRIIALTGHSRLDVLAEQCREFRPDFAVVGDPASARRLQDELRGGGVSTEVLHGPAALCQIASLDGVDGVMAAIVGAAGLAPTLAAVQAGKTIYLANKEALVMAGPVFMAEVQACGATLLPIDSEHNAIFQSLPDHFLGDFSASGVRRIILTASGGPFRKTPRHELAAVTPEQACAHPNWVMGRKISVDSATMMNKGLEVIEAHWLFRAPADRIQVMIHPQSIIHSMVEYADGSVISQMGNPDMRTPIAHALAYPERMSSGVASLDLCSAGPLSFEPPDFDRFPCLDLAFRALRAEGSAAAILNAANEVAVAAFLDRRLPFLGISGVIAETLEKVPAGKVSDLESVMAADGEARRAATKIVYGLIA